MLKQMTIVIALGLSLAGCMTLQQAVQAVKDGVQQTCGFIVTEYPSIAALINAFGGRVSVAVPSVVSEICTVANSVQVNMAKSRSLMAKSSVVTLTVRGFKIRGQFVR